MEPFPYSTGTTIFVYAALSLSGLLIFSAAVPAGFALLYSA
jgi:hypothetical protein